MNETKKLVYLNTTELMAHPDNPRKNIGDVTELADSIKKNGILQNLTVVPSEQVFDDVKGKYVVIIGHRRLAAAQAAGVESVPCAVTDMTQAEQIHTMMVENMQREDLTPIEQADGFQMMLDLGYTTDDITEQTGFSKATINHRLKMRELDREKFQASQERGGTISDYIALEQIEDVKEKNKVLAYIGTNDFRNILQRALNEQKQKKEHEKIREYLATKCTKMTDEEADHRFYMSEWETVKGYMQTLEDAKSIVFEEGVKYWYQDKVGIGVYKKPTKKPVQKKSKEEIALEKWRNDCNEKLEEIVERHKQLRIDFIREHSEASLIRSKKLNVVMKYAAMLSVPSAGDVYGLPYMNKSACDYYNAMDKKEPEIYGDKAEDGKKARRDLAEKLPARSLMAHVYAMLESRADFYRYSCDNKFEQRKGTEDMLYAFLADMGYEMSTEEKEMLKGDIINAMNERCPKK